jgi:UBA-like domain
MKLNSLSTTETNDDKITAFMCVLACGHDEAVFFLESADWSVETAVSLWLENGQGQYQNRSTHSYSSQQPQFGEYFSSASSSSSSTYVNMGSYRDRESGEHKGKRSRSLLYDTGEEPDFRDKDAWYGPLMRPGPYLSREVVIDGLDPAWTAWVSRSSGRVYFKHVASGHTQSQVPPGFADDPHWGDAQKQREEEGACDSDLENEVGRSPTLEGRAAVSEGMSCLDLDHRPGKGDVDCGIGSDSSFHHGRMYDGADLDAGVDGAGAGAGAGAVAGDSTGVPADVCMSSDGPSADMG